MCPCAIRYAFSPSVWRRRGCWLKAGSLDHPEAARLAPDAELPFPWLVGRKAVETGGKPKRAHELEIVLRQIIGRYSYDPGDPALHTRLIDYATWIVNRTPRLPTDHARLTGSAATEWIEAGANGCP